MQSKSKGSEAVSTHAQVKDGLLADRPGGSRSAPADSVECSLSLPDVLEDEFQQISGDAPVAPPPWEFDATQILKPEELRLRLIEGRDRAARGLADRELKPLVAGLLEKGAPKGADDLAALAIALATGFNALLDRADLYQDGASRSPTDSDTAARFAGVRFRSQTRERMITGPVRQRNRLILEDAFPEIQSRDDARLAKVFARAHQRKLAALCLSGGGIRSASFALGVVQGLGRLGLLERFHYLSTVSGGGYVGAWLSAWMHRAGRDRVIEELTERTGRPLAPEPAPLFHFRNFSSYLSPRIGLTSTDTWTLAAIYLRNLFLNWLVLVPLLATALVWPQLLVALTRLPLAEGKLSVITDSAFIVLLLLSVVLGVAAVRYVHANRPIQAANGLGAVDDPKGDHRAFVRWCFLPMLGAATVLTVIWAWVASGKVSFLAATGQPGDWHLTLLLGDWSIASHSAWAWAGVGAVVHLGGWALAGRRRSWSEFLFILATGAFGGLAAGAIAHGLAPSAPRNTPERLEQYAWYVSFAAPALLATFLVFGHIYVGATSRTQAEATFEWSARYSAWLQIAIAAWVAACGIVLLVPLGLGWALSRAADAEELIKSAKVIASVLGVGAGALTLLNAYTGRSSAGSPAASNADPRARIVQALSLPIFVVALLAALSYLVGWLMDVPQQLSPFFADDSCAVPDPARSGRHYYYHYALSTVICGSVPSVLVVLATLAGGGLLLSLLIDTNRFSLHGMYHARLVRTFLGASRNEQERDPNRFTGFDEHDDIALADLVRGDRPGPFHVVNVALNLVMRDEFASQQRKAISMTISPLHSGASRMGYRPTRDYGGGVTLGTAITISGAAASPEMGYHSKPLLSFLLTLFNIRLGWWLGNPGYAGRRNFRDSAPASSVLPIIDEALGRTDDRNPYVYLSDGGHFENLGLYEMVLRRCHWIVVSDAGCDPHAAFEDLGNAMRRIRVDFGIPIVFASVPICSREEAGARKADATYCAIGRIKYSEVDGNVEDGTLIYIKPAFYGSEPPDIFNSARTCPFFPHESTANQFFTEAQFESYRRLGSYIVQHIARGEPTKGKDHRRLALEAFAARVDALLRGNGAQQAGGRSAP
jgi:patatin-like phospholipase